MEDQIIRLLKDNKLRQTAARKEVLKVFIQNPVAHSHAELEGELDHQFDRVTVYRTLDSFLKSGIIHKVPSSDGAAQFALCENCSEHAHHDNHVHFKCTICGISECLHELSIPTINLPQGYIKSEANLLIEGRCAKCS